MKIFCVIPAFNEGSTIADVIKEVGKYVDNIVVVDDGSKDETAKIAERQEKVFLLHHIINRGQGASLQTGNEFSLSQGAEVIIHFDADGQFLAEEIGEVIAPLASGEADIVFGSRFMGRQSKMPWTKKNIIMPLAKLTNRLFLHVNTTDPQSGFRAMTAQTARLIAIENDGMAHCSEILLKSFRLGLRIREVPITVIYNNFGQKFSGGLKVLKELFLGRLIN